MVQKKHTGMSGETKNKLGNFLAILVVLLCIWVPLGFLYGTAVLFWFLFIWSMLPDWLSAGSKKRRLCLR